MIPRIFILPVVICITVFGLFSQEASSPKIADSIQAATLNNVGVAYMNQQLFEKALNHFEQAAKLDSHLAIADVNRAIALLNLGRIADAKPLLDKAVKSDPKDPHAWYSLGLLQKNSSDPQAAVDAFRKVIEIDPTDADTWYFLGSVYSQLRQFPEAIDAFNHALQLNPLHASAQFGLSRAFQQSGDTAHAREHLTRFQYVTQHKLGAAISLAYGDQGKYSLAEESPSVGRKSSACDSGEVCGCDAGSWLDHEGSRRTGSDLASTIWGLAHASWTTTATASSTFFFPITEQKEGCRYITISAMGSLKM